VNPLFIYWASCDRKHALRCKLRALHFAENGDEAMTRMWLDMHRTYHQSSLEWMTAARTGTVKVDPLAQARAVRHN
jgi:hypothetical protein